jgi:hypothetical protein
VKAFLQPELDKDDKAMKPTMMQEEKTYKDPTVHGQEQTATTQDVVPELIDKLHNATIEVLQNSNGPPLTFLRDPHLRLRRTLTPRSNVTGIPRYSEAQFVIHPTTGKRRTLNFETALEGGDENEFLMDAYFWGASEEEASVRLVACHGISPTASRDRWHALGMRIHQDPLLSKKVRFVALDWHSIDRSDDYQEEFLTLLPKHIFDCPSQEVVKEIAAMFSKEEDQENFQNLMANCREWCPRNLSDGAQILKAVITQGLGWGTPSKPFILCVKSWSGGIGVKLLAATAAAVDAEDEEAAVFRKSIAGVVIMHPAVFQLSAEEVKNAIMGIPALLVWAKDDQMVPYPLSLRFLVHDDVNLVTYETGHHGSFDGSNSSDPNFDDNIIAWLQTKYK